MATERIFLQLANGEHLQINAGFQGVQEEFRNITNRPAMEKVCTLLNEHPKAGELFLAPARIMIVS